MRLELPAGDRLLSAALAVPSPAGDLTVQLHTDGADVDVPPLRSGETLTLTWEHNVELLG